MATQTGCPDAWTSRPSALYEWVDPASRSSIWRRISATSSGWATDSMLVSSITGLVLAQSAFQTGGLAAAVSAEQVLQPLTGVALGVGLLDERLELSGPVGTVIVGAALIAMLGGVLMLARVENPGLASYQRLGEKCRIRDNGCHCQVISVPDPMFRKRRLVTSRKAVAP